MLAYFFAWSLTIVRRIVLVQDGSVIKRINIGKMIYRRCKIFIDMVSETLPMGDDIVIDVSDYYVPQNISKLMMYRKFFLYNEVEEQKYVTHNDILEQLGAGKPRTLTDSMFDGLTIVNRRNVDIHNDFTGVITIPYGIVDITAFDVDGLTGFNGYPQHVSIMECHNLIGDVNIDAELSVGVYNCVNITNITTTALKLDVADCGLTNDFIIPPNVRMFSLYNSALVTSLICGSLLTHLTICDVGISGVFCIPDSVKHINIKGVDGITRIDGNAEVYRLHSMVGLEPDGFTIPQGCITVDIRECHTLTTIGTIPDTLVNMSYYMCNGISGIVDIGVNMDNVSFKGCTNIVGVIGGSLCLDMSFTGITGAVVLNNVVSEAWFDECVITNVMAHDCIVHF